MNDWLELTEFSSYPPKINKLFYDIYIPAENYFNPLNNYTLENINI